MDCNWQRKTHSCHVERLKSKEWIKFVPNWKRNQLKYLFLYFLILIAVLISDRILEDWRRTDTTGHHRIVPSLYHGVHKTPITSTLEEVSRDKRDIVIKYMNWKQTGHSLSCQMGQTRRDTCSCLSFSLFLYLQKDFILYSFCKGVPLTYSIPTCQSLIRFRMDFTCRTWRSSMRPAKGRRSLWSYSWTRSWFPRATLFTINCPMDRDMPRRTLPLMMSIIVITRYVDDLFRCLRVWIIWILNSAYRDIYEGTRTPLPPFPRAMEKSKESSLMARTRFMCTPPMDLLSLIALPNIF